VRTSEGLKLRRGRAIDPESQGPSDLHVISCIGDSRVKAPSCCNENCDITIRDIPMSPEPSINLDACQKIRGSRSLGIGDSEISCSCSLESRNAISRRRSCVGPQQELVEDRWHTTSGIGKRKVRIH
jgi:hypothetical protein